MSGDRIDVDNRIYPGQSYTSQNGQYSFIFQDDSNLVLYKKTDDNNQEPLWSSDTYDGDNSSTNKSVILQGDGNFVMYNADGQGIWSSGTLLYEGLSKPYIVVQDDGNVVLYDEGSGSAIWSTETYQG
jgi:hypothetical protein